MRERRKCWNQLIRRWNVKCEKVDSRDVELVQAGVQGHPGSFSPPQAGRGRRQDPCPSEASAGGPNQIEGNPVPNEPTNLQIRLLPLRRKLRGEALASSLRFRALQSIHSVYERCKMLVSLCTPIQILILLFLFLSLQNTRRIHRPV